MRRERASWVSGLTLPGSCRAVAAPHQSAEGSCGVLAARVGAMAKPQDL